MTIYRDKKFIKDIVIAGDDGKTYYLKESEWKKHEVPLEQFKPEVRNMLKHGVALAAVPEPEGTPPTSPVLGFCYLVNLASLRTHTVFEHEDGKNKK